MKTLMKLLMIAFGLFVLASVLHEVRIERARRDHVGEQIRRRVHAIVGPRSPEIRTVQPRTDEIPSAPRRIVGLVSATEDRARADARLKLDDAVCEWLGLPADGGWRPPASLVEEMIAQTRIEPQTKDYGTVYTATLDVGFDDVHRDRLLAVHRSEVARNRTVKLGGLLGFMLVCLAATSGYIRADEATRGYYTNRLRLIAAGAVGASAVLLYQFLA